MEKLHPVERPVRNGLSRGADSDCELSYANPCVDWIVIEQEIVKTSEVVIRSLY